jgi:autotransporter-associated beta strand protein
MTISGIISGAGNFTKSGAGTMILSGANTYTGKTTVSAGILQLGAVNTIATSTGVTLSGGTLSPGGFSQSISGALTLSSASTIDVGLGGTLSFADSHTATWSGDLDLLNWTSANNDDTLQFGASAGGLTSAQLGDIEFDDSSSTLGDAAINAEGFVYEVPEPSTIAFGLLGGLGIFLMRRKKA